MLRSDSIDTRCGRSAASIQSVAIPASRASSRIRSSTRRLPKRERRFGAELPVADVPVDHAAIGLGERARFGREVDREAPDRAVAQPPARQDSRWADRLRADRLGAREPRHQMLAAQGKKLAVKRTSRLLIGAGMRARSLEGL